ncbi:MAG TPA: DUF72 domain-containing protein [Blastocatellia bacterium]|nr:DUF72 domain-containing protein [Blastocatellia bacterium]
MDESPVHNAPVHIGAQGWNYDDWVGPFYPRGTRGADYLDVYVKAFDTVEIDSSFYAIPSEQSVKSWRARAPAGFTYSLKLTQEITHQNRLTESGDVLARFCERARAMGDRLALILIQMPPDFSPRSMGALGKFLPLLPADLRFAIEFRDRGWLGGDTVERVLELLTAHRVALALTDSKWIPRELMFPLVERPTADFAYARWLGPRELTDYSRIRINRDRELAEWAEAFRALRRHVTQAFGYFNNHYAGHSPASANQFKKLLGLPVVEPETLVAQPSLF